MPQEHLHLVALVDDALDSAQDGLTRLWSCAVHVVGMVADGFRAVLHQLLHCLLNAP